MTKARIGVLGTGDVGRALGGGFAAEGHEVKIGSREPQSPKVSEWVKKTGTRASAGTFADAAAFGEVVIVATGYSVTKNALDLAGIERFTGKVVIDCTNPLVPGSMPPKFSIGHSDSAGEQVQRWLPAAKVVKAFNSVGNAHMVHPTFPGGPPDMFICGNDPAAKQVVAELCGELGWPTVDCGPIEASRMVEPLCLLWVSYGIKSGTWNHAFKLLRK
jgi:NADPH-dependent F420 reductase